MNNPIIDTDLLCIRGTWDGGPTVRAKVYLANGTVWEFEMGFRSLWADLIELAKHRKITLRYGAGKFNVDAGTSTGFNPIYRGA